MPLGTGLLLLINPARYADNIVILTRPHPPIRLHTATQPHLLDQLRLLDQPHPLILSPQGTLDVVLDQDTVDILVPMLHLHIPMKGFYVMVILLLLEWSYLVTKETPPMIIPLIQTLNLTALILNLRMISRALEHLITLRRTLEPLSKEEILLDIGDLVDLHQPARRIILPIEDLEVARRHLYLPVFLFHRPSIIPRWRTTNLPFRIATIPMKTDLVNVTDIDVRIPTRHKHMNIYTVIIYMRNQNETQRDGGKMPSQDSPPSTSTTCPYQMNRD